VANGPNIFQMVLVIIMIFINRRYSVVVSGGVNWQCAGFGVKEP